MAVTAPLDYCYPFSRKKNGDLSYKWFPIGWAVNVHDIGDGLDPRDGYNEWRYGTLEYLIDDGCWWVNCIYPLVHSNMYAWEYPMWRQRDQWTTDETYVRLLDYLEKKKHETDGKIDIQAMVSLIGRFDDNLQFYLQGDWDGIPNNVIEKFVERVKLLSIKPHLAGWTLVDEPYAGAMAGNMGIRDRVYEQLKYCKFIIESNDPFSYNHPIWTIIRGNGNYNFNPCIQKEYVPFLDQLIGIGDYICDDLYLGDFINNADGSFIDLVKDRTIDARRILIERDCNVPDLKNNPAYLLWSQGEDFSPAVNPTTGDGYLTEEQLRYQNYCTWINGGMGAMFWQLSKSDIIAYTRAKKVSYEAYKASEFLMNSQDSDLRCFMHFDNDMDCQFILRRNPYDENELLWMVCNSSRHTGYVKLSLPTTFTIKSVRPIVNNYDWDITTYRDKKTLRITMNELEGRAFLIKI